MVFKKLRYLAVGFILFILCTNQTAHAYFSMRTSYWLYVVIPAVNALISSDPNLAGAFLAQNASPANIQATPEGVDQILRGCAVVEAPEAAASIGPKNLEAIRQSCGLLRSMPVQAETGSTATRTAEPSASKPLLHRKTVEYLRGVKIRQDSSRSFAFARTGYGLVAGAGGLELAAGVTQGISRVVALLNATETALNIGIVSASVAEGGAGLRRAGFAGLTASATIEQGKILDLEAWAVQDFEEKRISEAKAANDSKSRVEFRTAEVSPEMTQSVAKALEECRTLEGLYPSWSSDSQKLDQILRFCESLRSLAPQTESVGPSTTKSTASEVSPMRQSVTVAIPAIPHSLSLDSTQHNVSATEKPTAPTQGASAAAGSSSRPSEQEKRERESKLARKSLYSFELTREAYRLLEISEDALLVAGGLNIGSLVALRQGNIQASNALVIAATSLAVVNSVLRIGAFTGLSQSAGVEREKVAMQRAWGLEDIQEKMREDSKASDLSAPPPATGSRVSNTTLNGVREVIQSMPKSVAPALKGCEQAESLGPGVNVDSKHLTYLRQACELLGNATQASGSASTGSNEAGAPPSATPENKATSSTPSLGPEVIQYTRAEEIRIDSDQAFAFNEKAYALLAVAGGFELAEIVTLQLSILQTMPGNSAAAAFLTASFTFSEIGSAIRQAGFANLGGNARVEIGKILKLERWAVQDYLEKRSQSSPSSGTQSRVAPTPMQLPPEMSQPIAQSLEGCTVALALDPSSFPDRQKLGMLRRTCEAMGSLVPAARPSTASVVEPSSPSTTRAIPAVPRTLFSDSIPTAETTDSPKASASSTGPAAPPQVTSPSAGPTVTQDRDQVERMRASELADLSLFSFELTKLAYDLLVYSEVFIEVAGGLNLGAQKALAEGKPEVAAALVTAVTPLRATNSLLRIAAFASLSKSAGVEGVKVAKLQAWAEEDLDESWASPAAGLGLTPEIGPGRLEPGPRPGMAEALPYFSTDEEVARRYNLNLKPEEWDRITEEADPVHFASTASRAAFLASSTGSFDSSDAMSRWGSGPLAAFFRSIQKVFFPWR